MSEKKFIQLRDLEVYQLSRKLSSIAWKIYDAMDWQTKKAIGDQFIRATDSVGANIAEGYGRYHYKDKVKFFYNSRASLVEANDHWKELIEERKLAEAKLLAGFSEIARELGPKLNNFISSTMRASRSDSKQ